MTQQTPLTPRQRFIAALELEYLAGRVPHFELVFFLTMETFGKVHPSHRNYEQWGQMHEHEHALHRNEMADIFVATAERFDHSAIFVHPNPDVEEERWRMVELIREKSGSRYFLMAHGDATFGIPTMTEFSYRMADEPDKLEAEAQAKVDTALQKAERQMKHGGLDGYALCTDYCFNTGPFLRPSKFAEFVAPYLAQLIRGYRDLGFYTIKYTDGNIMPILDQLVECNPHALHSPDPQGGVDIAEVKRRYGSRVCLIGTVNCGLLDTGTDAEVIESAQYALAHGSPNGGYVFSTSNCIYPRMRLERYELMLNAWRNFDYSIVRYSA